MRMSPHSAWKTPGPPGLHEPGSLPSSCNCFHPSASFFLLMFSQLYQCSVTVCWFSVATWQIALLYGAARSRLILSASLQGIRLISGNTT